MIWYDKTKQDMYKTKRWTCVTGVALYIAAKILTVRKMKYGFKGKSVIDLIFLT